MHLKQGYMLYQFHDIHYIESVKYCLPKEGKDKSFINNWHSITLFCGNFKLVSSCIASKLKPILQNIIGKKNKIIKRKIYWCMCEISSTFYG